MPDNDEYEAPKSAPEDRLDESLEVQDRLRRIVNPRAHRSKPTPVYNVPDFDETGEHIAPHVFETESEPAGNSDEIRFKSTLAEGSFAYDVTFENSFERKHAAERSSQTFEDKESSSGLDKPLHQIVPGYEIENEAGLCYCTVQAIPIDESRGPLPLASLLELQPALFHRFHPTFGLSQMADYRRAAFIDTETTGLGGGASVYCFMVGIGTFEAYQPYAPDQLPVDPDPNSPPTHFVVRQFFMRNPAEEGALLVAVSDLLANQEMTVTFNGRSFDLPMLRGRYSQNRRLLPGDRNAPLLNAERPHLDLLMPARRVWRRRLQSCRLINLEQMILGLQRSEHDVPGYEIPILYENYVRTGYARALRGIFYHNNEDIVTMVALADHLSRAFEDTPAPASTNSSVMGMDWAGLGRMYERAGDIAQAEVAYTRALESVRNPADRADLFRALGELYKRQKQWLKATELWQQWITTVPGSDVTPYIELAKYSEWEARDLEQAEMWTSWALHTIKQARPAARRPGEQYEVEKRLVRIQRKRNIDGGTIDLT